MKLPSVKLMKNVLGRKSPTILTVLSIGGLVLTTVMAVRATPKVLDLIADERHARDEDEEYEKFDQPMTKFDITKLVWPCYIPTIVMGAATVASIIGSNAINLKRNVALTSAYYLSETALKEYQAKVIKTIGENKAKLIKDEIAQDHVSKTKKNGNTVIVTGNGDTLCFDYSSGRYFKSSYDKIKKAQNDINYSLISENYLSLNEIYGHLNLEPVSNGRELGWDLGYNGQLEFDISTCMSEDNEPCLSIAFSATPRPRY